MPSDWIDELTKDSEDDWINLLLGEPEVVEPELIQPTIRPPKQPAPFRVISPGGVAEMGGIGFGPRPPGGWDDQGRPLDEAGRPYLTEGRDTSRVGEIMAETISGLNTLSAHPMETIRGGLDVFLSLPGFTVGFVGATLNSISELAHQMMQAKSRMEEATFYGEKVEAFVIPFDLNRIYDVASKNMAEAMEFFEPGKELLIGERTPESELAAQVIMAPITALSALGHQVAAYEGLRNYPNIQGAAKFIGDILGLVAMGGLVRGRARRARAAKEVESIVTEAREIIQKEQSIATLDDVAKIIQQKTLEVQKIRLEYKAKKLAEDIGEDVLIHEDWLRREEDVAKAKIRPVQETGLKKPKIKKPKAKEPTIKDSPELTKIKKRFKDLPVKVDALGEEGTTTPRGEVQVTITEGPAKGASISVQESFTPAFDKIQATQKKFRRAKKEPKVEVVEETQVDRYHRNTSVPAVRDALERGDIAKARAIYNQTRLEKSPLWGKRIKEEIEQLEARGLRPSEVSIEDARVELRELIEKERKEPGSIMENDVYVLAGRIGDDRILRALELDTWEARVNRLDELTKPERITEVDQKTGTPVPGLEGERSPFYADKETTDTFTKIFDERADAVMDSVETYTQKVINDVRRWYFGDDTVNINVTRNELSGLASNAETYRNEFMTGVDHFQWKETVSEAASWARKLERPAVEPRKVVSMSDAMIEKLRKSLMARAEDSIDHLLRVEQAELSIVRPDIDISFVRKDMNTGNVIYKVNSGRFKDREFTVEKAPLPDKPIRELELGDIDVKPVIESYDKAFGKYGLEIVKEGPKLYSGIPIEEGARMIIEDAKKVTEYMKKARGAKAFKPKQAAKMLREEFNRSFVDRSGNIRGELLNMLGDAGYRVLQRMYLAKGASSISANMLRQMRKEVYAGLSRQEKRVLDEIILDDRMIDIAKYKSGKEFKHPDGLTPEHFIKHRETFHFIEKLTPERAAELDRRAAAYYEWMKKPLQDMLDAQLISQAEYDALVSHNYRRIKLVDIYDKRYKTKVGKKKRTVYDSGVETLARGRESDIYEPSSEVMALEVFNRAYGRILNNRANLELLNVARAQPENPFVRFKEKEGDKIPSGWNRVFVFEEGQRKAIYLSPEFSKEWIISDPELSYKTSQILRFASGSVVLRTFATGINWGFALANLPRDVMHAWYAARMFEPTTGKWKGVYSPFLPSYAMQMTRDLATVFSDAAGKKGRYQDYIDEGGGMEFLVHQGRLFQRGKHVDKPLTGLYDFMGYFGETSELMTRLAIRDRVIRRRAKEQGISVKEARKNEDITREATFAARDYMDFGQGGGIAKAVDNAVPYANAIIQGTRGLWRAFKPGSGTAMSSTFKLSQFAALTTGIYIAARSMAPKTTEAMRGSVDAKNNLILPLGDDFGFEDEQGQMRYFYAKIPLDPGQKFFKTFFEASADKWLGYEVDVDRVVDSLKEFSPVGTTTADILPPTISGTLGYVTNKDFWLNEDIWRKTDKPFSYPFSKEEFIPGKTPQAYIDIGKMTGLSPERTRYMVEELTTSGTIWSYLAGRGYDELFGTDFPESNKKEHLAMVLAKTPISRRFIGVTNPYSKYAAKIEKAEEESTIERFVQNRETDRLTKGYLYEDNTTRKEVFKYIHSFKDRDIRERLTDRFKWEEVIKNLPEKSFWRRMKGLNTEVRAEIFVDRLNAASAEERDQLWKEYNIVNRAGGLISENFRREVGRLRSQP